MSDCEEPYRECVASRSARIGQVLREMPEATNEQLAAAVPCSIRAIQKHRNSTVKGGVNAFTPDSTVQPEELTNDRQHAGYTCPVIQLQPAVIPAEAQAAIDALATLPWNQRTYIIAWIRASWAD